MTWLDLVCAFLIQWNVLRKDAKFQNVLWGGAITSVLSSLECLPFGARYIIRVRIRTPTKSHARSQGKRNCLRNQNLGAIAFFALNRVQRGHRLPLVKLIHILKNNRRTSKMLTDGNHQSLHARGFSQLRNSCMGRRVYWHILFQVANTLWRQSFVLADITLILSCEF